RPCLFGRRRRGVRLRGGEVVEEALPRDVVEEGEELIDVLLREGILFVIAAARTSRREAEPYSRRGADAGHYILGAKLLVDDAALGAGAMVAVKSGRDLFRQRRVRQQVAGDLFDRELIERHVAMERVDHPVAPSPHVAR